MEERNKKQIVGAVDAVVGIFIIITGIFVLIFAILLYDTVPPYATLNYFIIAIWIFIWLGIATIIYGIKRIIDDVIIT